MKPDAVISFVRMNPLHKGHEGLIRTILSVTDADPYLFLSSANDPQRNPLSIVERHQFIRNMGFGDMLPPTDPRTLDDAMKWLASKGYKKVTYVVGEDRSPKMKCYMEKYAPTFGIQKTSVYTIKRDKPAISATEMRIFAARGDFSSFSHYAPATMSSMSIKLMYALVRSRVS